MRNSELIRAVVEHCRRHGGVITTPDIRAKGGTSRQLAGLVRDHVLARRHPGVYVIAGAACTPASELVVAIARMRLTDPAHPVAASHGSAAWLQGVADAAPDEAHLTTTARHGRTLAGVIVHRTQGTLERRPFQGIPCTLPARTLVDLAATVPPSQLANAIDRALALRIVPTRDLLREIQKGHRRGTDRLRRSLEERGDLGAPTPSVLESRMARVITRYRLPLPKAELIAGRDGEYRIDYTNPALELAVELYGYTWHHSPNQMAHDHARQRRLTIEGWTVLIFTWKDVTHHPERLARDIHAALTGRPRSNQRLESSS